MTKTVKKRLQAVVALLVTLMIMVGIMPTDILSTTVYAADNTTRADAEEMKTGWSWLYVQLDSQLVNGNSNMAGKVLGAWGNPGIVSKSSMVAITKPTGWGNVYAYGFESWPSSIEVVASGSYSGYNGYSSITLNSPTAGHIYKLMCDGGGGYMKYKDIATYSDLVEDAGGNNSSSGDDIVVDLEDHVTFAANIYDYHYDYEQKSDYTNKRPGNSKRPFSIFNDGVVNSDYGTTWDESQPSTKRATMYLGQFWIKDENTSTYNSSSAGHVKAGNDYGGKDSSGNGLNDVGSDYGTSLTHFYWGANLAYRGKSSGGNEIEERFHAAACGLVDDQLVGGMLKSKGQNVPYFDTAFLGTSASGATKSYGSWGTTDFTFTKRSMASKYPSDSSPNKTYTADYYVYSSAGYEGSTDVRVKDANNNSFRDNLYVTKGANGANWNSTYTKDSSAVDVRDVQNKSGFLPFNTSGTSAIDLNFGFGMKWQMNFRVTSTGHLGDSDETPMVFKFKGDDDLWVFIDDCLVLDMGGAHKEAEGEINFKTLTWYIDLQGKAKYQEIYGTTVSEDDLVPASGSFATLSNGTTFDRTKSHKMTIFYMERGMINSNLYIQYNFIPVEDSVKVQEVTDGFDQVNPGLQALTRKAADYDVFTYNVQAAASTGKTNKVLVTDNTLTRTVVGKTDELTTSGTAGTAYSYDTLGSPAYLANVGYRWGDDFASISPNSTYKYMSGVTDVRGYFDLLYGTDAKSSYAKFENQIGRDRVIVGQQANLKKSVSGTISTTTRSVPTYYEVSVPGYDDETNDADSHKTAVATSSNTNPTGVGFTENGGAPVADFFFGQSPTYSADDAVNVTLTFRNTVKYYSITFSKGIVDTSNNVVSNNDEFTFKLTLSDILGIDEVDVAADGYGGITITKGGHSDTLNGDGTITAKASETVVIGGIPAGTNYSIVEVDASSNNTIALNGEFSIGDNAYKLNNMQNQTLTTGLLGDILVHFTNVLQDEETPSVDIGIIKRWYPLNSSTTLPTEIKFLLQKSTNGTTWEDVQEVTLHTSGTSNVTVKKYDDQNTEVTGSGAYEYAQWTLSTRITVPKDTDVQYRILEYSEGDKALILLNEGLYATDCKAYYKDGNNDTNVKALSAATYANNTELVAWLVANHKIVSGADETTITTAVQGLSAAEKTSLTNAGATANPVIELAVKNEYIPMGTAMPKTGAAGVYAIVTFGAFAITIAGVALLIYRKKLQTVNIYAVKGSEKPKE